MLVFIKPTMERAQKVGSTFVSSRLGTERDDHSNADAQRQFAIPVVMIGYTRLSKQKFDFIKRVDKGWITTVKDLESWRFER